jgi:hypothetical protein
MVNRLGWTDVQYPQATHIRQVDPRLCLTKITWCETERAIGRPTQDAAGLPSIQAGCTINLRDKWGDGREIR